MYNKLPLFDYWREQFIKQADLEKPISELRTGELPFEAAKYFLAAMKLNIDDLIGERSQITGTIANPFEETPLSNTDEKLKVYINKNIFPEGIFGEGSKEILNKLWMRFGMNPKVLSVMEEWQSRGGNITVFSHKVADQVRFLLGSYNKRYLEQTVGGEEYEAFKKSERESAERQSRIEKEQNRGNVEHKLGPEYQSDLDRQLNEDWQKKFVEREPLTVDQLAKRLELLKKDEPKLAEPEEGATLDDDLIMTVRMMTESPKESFESPELDKLVEDGKNEVVAKSGKDRVLFIVGGTKESPTIAVKTNIAMSDNEDNVQSAGFLGLYKGSKVGEGNVTYRPVNNIDVLKRLSKALVDRVLAKNPGMNPSLVYQTVIERARPDLFVSTKLKEPEKKEVPAVSQFEELAKKLEELQKSQSKPEETKEEIKEIEMEEETEQAAPIASSISNPFEDEEDEDDEVLIKTEFDKYINLLKTS